MNEQNIAIKNIYGINNIESILNKLNPSAQYKYGSVILDTNNTDENLTSDTKYGWRFDDSTILETGTVNSTANIKNIIGMRLFPITTTLATPIGEPNKIYVSNVANINHNFTLLIDEFKSQCFVGRNGFKYHFVLFPQLMNPTILDGIPITPSNPYIEYATSGKGNGWFWFRTPIKSFSTLTVTMGNPFDLVKVSSNTRTLIPIQFIYLE